VSIKYSAVMVVRADSRFLIVRRSSTAPWMPLRWSLPGGTIEEGESPLEAGIREVYEEVNLDLDPGKTRQEKVVGPVQYYTCEPGGWTGSPALKLTDGILENDLMAWVLPDEAAQYDLLPGLLDTVGEISSRLQVERLRQLIRQQLKHA
jgi:8-oxo-dGTP pyrophosphatase MutT (NUDIX family)